MVMSNWLRCSRSLVGLLAVIGPATVGVHGAGAQSLDFRIGWVTSGLNGSRVIEHDALQGVSLDVAAAFPVTSRLSLEPGLQLMVKGATRRSSAMGVFGSDTTFSHITDALHLLYVQVPVLARVELSAGHSGLRPYVAGGPYVGWMLKCSGYLMQPTASGLPSQVAGDSTSVGAACLNQGTRRLEVGVAASAGVRVPLGSVAGLVDVRYERGLSNVVQSVWGEAHNHALVASVGVSLPVGGGGRVRGG